MRIVPDSTISLYSNIPITADNDEQLVFSSLAHQASYFANHLVLSKINCQIVKKTGRLRIHASASRIKDCNYLSFVNPSWDNKTFYCKIKDYNYINNECVEISYTIDVFQTWLFDVSYSDMYIEREHLSQADYLKAETNPYDPSIYEFKTAEELPFNKDIEKPYYSINDQEFQSGYDGLLVGEAIRHTYSVGDAAKIGVLMELTDINFESLQDGSTALAGQNTAQDFVDIIKDLITHGSVDCFYSLSTATYNTITDVYSLSVSQSDKGSGWNLSPWEGGSVRGPVNYIYFGSAASNPSSTGADDLGEMLKLLTRWNLIDNIIAMYPIPSGIMMCAGAAAGNIYSATLGSAKTYQNVRNKKLDLYPYCYYRLIGPNGDIKELRMEDFKALQEGQDGATIGMSLDITSSPQLYVGPIDYKMERVTSGANMNINETFIFNQFPTMPYSIDGYLAHLASVANSIIGNNTLEYGYDVQQKQLDQYKQFASAIAGGVAAGGNLTGLMLGAKGASLGGGIEAGVNGLFAGGQYEITKAKNELEFSQSEAAYDFVRGSEKNAITDNYQFTKPAYAGADYHQSNGNGMSNFLDCAFFDIIFMRTSLNPQILAEYDKYFDNFGYNSGRCGIPRAINYINGVTGSTNLPHWATVSGHQTTYVKTKNCKVDYAMEPVSQGIKAIFDNGVRLIKGD